MLNHLLLQGFNRYVDPLVEIFCGDSKAKEFGVKIGLTALYSGASYAFFGWSEELSKFCHLISSTVFGSIITDNVDFGLKNLKELIADKLDDYGYDQYMDVVDPILDIGAGVALRKAGGFATSLPNPTLWMNSKNIEGINLQNHTEFAQQSYNKSKGFFSKVFGGIGDAASAVLNLGKNNQDSEGHLVSNSLDMAGGYMLLNVVIKGVTNICSRVRDVLTGKNQSELSVYDIKNIFKMLIPSEGYNRAEVMAQANQIFTKIQLSEKYFESFASKPEIQKNIEIVTGLYSKVIGAQLKAAYSSALADNPKLLEKSEVLVDKMMEAQVTTRLLSAKGMLSNIAQSKEHGIELPAEMKSSIKQAAQQQLSQELKQFGDISAEEQVAYKSLFSKASEIETEFTQLSYMMESFEASPEFD